MDCCTVQNAASLGAAVAKLRRMQSRLRALVGDCVTWPEWNPCICLAHHELESIRIVTKIVCT